MYDKPIPMMQLLYIAFYSSEDRNFLRPANEGLYALPFFFQEKYKELTPPKNSRTKVL